MLCTPCRGGMRDRAASSAARSRSPRGEGPRAKAKADTTQPGGGMRHRAARDMDRMERDLVDPEATIGVGDIKGQEFKDHVSRLFL